MKVMQFNVQHFRNYITREIDFIGFAKVINNESPDIVSLNEVFDEDSAKFGNEAFEISKLTNINYFFGRAITIPMGNYGNAILSKYPIINPEIIKIDDPITHDEDCYYESRIIIKCQINDYTIICTHMGLANQERINAVNKVLEVTKNINQKLIILGDFNMEPDNNIIKPLTCKYIYHNNEFTFPSDKPVDKRDYILVSKDIKVINSKVINKVISDHLPLVLEIDEKIV